MAPKRIPELLSPAGNLEAALAAFDGGADAVYCGLGKFNARMRAGNFDRERLGALLRFAREHGKKVYLTFNTLLQEDELPEAMEALSEIALLAPDALIVQDPCIAYLLKRYFPQLVLHASTQMNLHNSAGIAMAEKLGFRRVILERQLTMEELRKIVPQSKIELEVFLHGSLCCSLSGRCLLSSSLFHCSGNRGLCRQPCRNRYNGKYLLSPADLDGVSVLPELRKLGIASLKIEGRLRSPGYVWKTAHAYRLLLDGPEEPEPERLAEARTLLDSAAGREGSSGFFDPHGFSRLIRADRPGSFGQLAGTVLQSSPRGIRIRAEQRLHLGDRLRFAPPAGGDGESFSLVRLVQQGKPVLKIRQGSEAELLGNYSCRPGWKLYKIGENGFDFSRRAATLPAGTFAQKLKISLSADGLSVSLDSLPGQEWKHKETWKTAQKHACSAQQLAEEFTSGVPEPWRGEVVSCTAEPGLFMPAGVLKQLRREFWSWAAGKLPPPLPDPRPLEEFRKEYFLTTPAPGTPLPQGEKYQIPAFLPESRLAEESRRIQAAYQRGIRIFLCGSLHALELLASYPDIVRAVRFPFPVCNSAAVQLLAPLGVQFVEAEAELPAEAVEKLRAHSALPVLSVSERVPLLVTRLPLPTGRWQDDFFRVFSVEYDPEEKLYKLFAGGEKASDPGMPDLAR